MGVNLIGLSEDAPPAGRTGAPRPAGDFRRPSRPAGRLRARLAVGLALVLSVILVFIVVSRFGDARVVVAPPASASRATLQARVARTAAQRPAAAPHAVAAPAIQNNVAPARRDDLIHRAAVAGTGGHFGIARGLALRAGRADLAAAYEQAGLVDAGHRAQVALAQSMPRHALRIVRVARRRYNRPTALKAVAAQAINALVARRHVSGGAAA